MAAMSGLRGLSPLGKVPVRARPHPVPRCPLEVADELVSTTRWALPLAFASVMLLQGGAATYAPPLGPELHWHPPVDESERTPEVVAAQQQRVEQALESGESVSFPNSQGESIRVRLRAFSWGYRYRFEGEASVDVVVASAYRAQGVEALAKAIDYHSQVPVKFRDVVSEIRLEERPPASNTDARYQAWSRRITFYGLGCLDETNFTHEIGHGIGHRLESQADSWGEWLLAGWEPALLPDRAPLTPDPWVPVARQENPPTAYAREGASEDFAEFWTAYHEARESGNLDTLRQQYPARTATLERLLQGE